MHQSSPVAFAAQLRGAADANPRVHPSRVLRSPVRIGTLTAEPLGARNLRLKTSWTESDFDEMSWHDNHVHGMQIEVANPDHGTGILVLDLDYILEWLPPVEGRCRFSVAPATLSFHDVFGLRIELDWAAATAGMTPFSLSGIGREKVEYPSGFSWNWSIGVNWPEGLITFGGSRFTQALRGAPIVTADPCLSVQQRVSSAGG